MSEYYAVIRFTDHLAHTGVKGMKWGVRKKVDTDDKKIGNSWAYQKATEKLVIKNQVSDMRHPRDTTGKYGKGNINLNKRQVVHNKDGSISTERSFSVNIDGKETLLPTVINGKIVDEDTAIDHYFETGEHLGKFDTVQEAEDYAEKLHNRQDWYYNQNSKKKNSK